MILPHKKEEQALMEKGYQYIAGIDEAGRGPLAGPVVAVAVIMDPREKLISIIRDSKLLTEKMREKAYGEILEKCIDFGVGVVESDIIDEINIYQAAKLAMKEAVEKLKKVKPDYLLIDAMKIDLQIEQKSIIGGDRVCFSIAAASIIAKVTRDEIMKRYHQKYPNYFFDKHKGYATKLHLECLEKHGPCEIHRKTFNPIRNISFVK